MKRVRERQRKQYRKCVCGAWLRLVCERVTLRKREREREREGNSGHANNVHVFADSVIVSLVLFIIE